jgi:hypothetical protein
MEQPPSRLQPPGHASQSPTTTGPDDEAREEEAREEEEDGAVADEDGAPWEVAAEEEASWEVAEEGGVSEVPASAEEGPGPEALSAELTVTDRGPLAALLERSGREEEGGPLALVAAEGAWHSPSWQVAGGVQSPEEAHRVTHRPDRSQA